MGSTRSTGARGVANRRYRVGFGVAAAALFRAGVPVVAQRTLDVLLHRLDPKGPRLVEAVDHHEREWYRQTFGALPRQS
jgi:tRNA A37 threonylcarbamoyladenosine modification protein TsaB